MGMSAILKPAMASRPAKKQIGRRRDLIHTVTVVTFFLLSEICNADSEYSD